MLWLFEENASAQSLCVPRVLASVDDETLKSQPASAHYWLDLFQFTNRAIVEKGIAQGLKTMQGLDGSGTAEKFSNIMGTVNLPTPLKFPDFSTAPILAKCSCDSVKSDPNTKSIPKLIELTSTQ